MIDFNLFLNIWFTVFKKKNFNFDKQNAFNFEIIELFGSLRIELTWLFERRKVEMKLLKYKNSLEFKPLLKMCAIEL